MYKADDEGGLGIGDNQITCSLAFSIQFSTAFANIPLVISGDAICSSHTSDRPRDVITLGIFNSIWKLGIYRHEYLTLITMIEW